MTEPASHQKTAGTHSGSGGHEDDRAHPNEHNHDHEHKDHDGEHEHDRGQDHDDAHDHGSEGPLSWLVEMLPFGGHAHSHGHATVDSAYESSDQGIRALWISLLGLGTTALIQLVVALASGSAGLLADTIHNASDALTALPLWLAFSLGKRPPNRRYTYGYGRAEDIAGVIIVLVIALSALIAAYESVQKLLHPAPMSSLAWVAVASIVGFVGNEAVGAYRTRVGRQIGSAALEADGQHARADGLTSLAVLIGVAGTWLGFPLADPIVGLLITLAILFILKDTAVMMWERLMDAVDPEIVESVQRTAAGVPGVIEAHDPRIRWMGHRLQAELHITVDEDLPTSQSHLIVEHVRHALFHDVNGLAYVNIHVDPTSANGIDHHALTAHHAAAQPGMVSATSEVASTQPEAS